MALTARKVSWFLDADIQGFFDQLDHEWLMLFLSHRVRDRRVLELVSRTLRAGVEENGEVEPTRQGTPQGAVLSPLLANLYLHHVLDLWVNQWRQRHARGKVYIVRYADDFVLGFQYNAALPLDRAPGGEQGPCRRVCLGKTEEILSRRTRRRYDRT